MSFVSDVHGNTAALAEVAARAEQLVVLGDLLDYIDYHDPAAGILGDAFGTGPVLELTRMRTAGDFAAMHALSSRLWDSLDDPVGTLDGIVDERYRRVLAALEHAASPPLLILGNVDEQDRWQHAVGDALPALDGCVVEIAGRRLGFAAGGASRRAGPAPSHDDRPWRPFIKPADAYRRTVEQLGPVDLLCSHVPVDLPLLRYDRVPGRAEMFGPGLLEQVDRHQPRYALFGHVHQPLAQRVRRGRTECVNVGHFARTRQPFTLEW